MTAETQEQDAESASRNDYEYRLMGCSGGDWRITEWGDEETAERRWKNVTWGLRAIERREEGDNSTLQRRPSPDDEWQDVTDDMIHVEGEEVPTV